jgi:predicted amidohydrolase YtcJ
MATVWASYFVLKEKELGTIEPGKFADLLVLNKDYLSIPEADLPTIYPLMTVVGGKPIVVRQEYSAEVGLAASGPQMEFKSEPEEAE